MRCVLTAMLMVTFVLVSSASWAGGFNPPARTDWTFEAGETASATAIGGERVYVGTGDGSLCALSLRDGSPLWRASLGAPVAQAVTVCGERVFAGTAAGHMVCLRPPLLREGIVGVEDWRFVAGGAILSAPLVTPAGRTVFGAHDGVCYALDPQGRQVWQYRASAPVVGRVVRSTERPGDWYRKQTAPQDPLVYCCSRDGVVHAINEKTGAPCWSFATGAQMSAGPAIVGDTVLAGNESGKLVALDARSGRPSWTGQAGSPVTTPPAIAFGKVYVACEGGSVVGLSLTTGRQLWRTETAAPTNTTPIITDGGYVMVASGAGMVYALRPSDGRVLWGANMGKQLAPSMAIGNGKMVVATLAGDICALVPGGKWRVDPAPTTVLASSEASKPRPSAEAVPVLQTAPRPKTDLRSDAGVIVPASLPVAADRAGLPDFPNPLQPGGAVAQRPAPQPVALSLLTQTRDASQPDIQVADRPSVRVSGVAPEGTVAGTINDVPIRLAEGRYDTVVAFSGPGTFPVTLCFTDRQGRVTTERRVVVVSPSERSASSVPAFVYVGEGGAASSVKFCFDTPQSAADDTISVLTIQDRTGASVVEWAKVTDAATAFEWNGCDAWGKPLPGGEYVAVYTLRGLDDWKAQRLYQPIVIENTGM